MGEGGKGLYLVSGCLVGLLCRYDGREKKSEECQRFLEDKQWLPVCPEQLGGLATPRPAAEIRGGDGADVLAGRARVEIVATSMDVSAQFCLGARQVLTIAQGQPVAGVCLKARSPSCGVHEVLGVTAALLRQHGFRLYEFD